jgi:hypothetical protein
MSFIGNFAAAQSAKAIGSYNKQVYDQQAAYERAKADINKRTYDQVTKPLLLRKFNKDYSNQFVGALATGAEIRDGDSPYLALLDIKYNQATELVIADFNAEMDQTELINNSLLTEAKGIGAKFKGDATARAENIKGFASLLSFGQDRGYIGGGSK